MNVSERFLNYVAFATTSCEDNECCPSTQNQRVFADFLADEMRKIGISDVQVDANGYVTGTVPGDPALPTIGLIAHMDTAPDCSGENIHPQIIDYQGGDIVLNAAQNVVLREADFASLSRNRGKHLIVTDGTTLLGADDKAGIAEILTAAELLLASDIPHATLRIGFTPDEEIGRGADLFDVQAFGADYAYTCDGGTLGELEYENFNAASAVVRVRGVSIHPGSAKNCMVNAQQVAIEFHDLLPHSQRPEHTEGYEGFYHLHNMVGDTESATLQYIIRDFDRELFAEKKARMQKTADWLNDLYGEGTVTVELRDSYYNMKQKILPVFHVVERAERAMRAVGMQPVTVPIRGGTDGARLSFEGLPCPNLCTGGENYHGRYEYIPVEDMQQCVRMLVALLQMR